MTRYFDVVLFGATGFVGALTAGHLARHTPGGVRIALAGRSQGKLEAVRASLGGRAADWPLLLADATDAAGLASLVRRTRVVATTVGPYLAYGLPLVAACAAAGTHYADLTGELLFVRTAIDAHHQTAVASGARIVVSCGFDSVPSDLGVLALHRAVLADGAGELTQVRLVLGKAKGGFSGGTLASLLDQVGEMKTSRKARALVADPYALSADRSSETDFGRQSDFASVGRDAVSGEWVAPFVMAAYNTRIVRRSNSLLGHAYGKQFRYGEVMGFGPTAAGGLASTGVTAALAVGALGLVAAPRRLLDRVLPSPGEGPTKTQQSQGFFKLAVHGLTTTGAHYVARVEATGDPGYAATAVMLGESALALALDSTDVPDSTDLPDSTDVPDSTDLPDAAGVLTPATGIGWTLAMRLQTRGFTLAAERLGEA